MNPIKMLALDLDGTLAQANHQVLPKTRNALNRLHDSGVEVVIATGRRYRTTRFVIENLGFEVFAVCNGGALVKSPDSGTVAATHFDKAHLTSVTDIARGLGLSLFAQRDAHSLGGPDMIIDNVLDWDKHIKRYHKENKSWGAAGDLSAQAHDFLVVGVFGEEVALRAMADSIQSTFADELTCIVVPHHEFDAWYCEITQTHVDKWHGLSQLCEHKGISGDQLCTAGDQLNDLSMLTAATHSFAMGNGNPDIHAHAKAVCGDHDKDGLLDVVDYINAHNRT